MDDAFRTSLAHRLTALVAVAGLALVLAGCGSDDGGADAETRTTVTSCPLATGQQQEAGAAGDEEDATGSDSAQTPELGTPQDRDDGATNSSDASQSASGQAAPPQGAPSSGEETAPSSGAVTAEPPPPSPPSTRDSDTDRRERNGCNDASNFKTSEDRRTGAGG
jgi:hypothetical protein